MSILIKSSIFPKELGNILESEITKDQENLEASNYVSSISSYIINVSYSSTSNPICSVSRFVSRKG